MEAMDALRQDRETYAKWQKAEQRRRETSHIKGILKNPQPGPASTAGGSTTGPQSYLPPPTPQIKGKPLQLELKIS